MTASTITIARRFAGPPGSANGGYAAGRLASHVGESGPVSATLRRPPPLDTPLRVDGGPGAARLLDEDDLVAEATTADFGHPAPPAVGLERAHAAEQSYGGLVRHPFPTCFVCGTARRTGDGLRLAPGSFAPGRTACVWTPDPSLSARDNPTAAAAEFVWAALDCPGGWTSGLQDRPLVLGRITAWYDRIPLVGQPYVVVGALHGQQGRKTFTAAALYDAAGALLARAEHIWIAIDPARF